MPEFRRPQRAIIETGDDFDPGPLVLVAAVVVALGVLVAFVIAHLVFIAVCAGALVAIGTGGVLFLRRFTMVTHDVPQPELPVSARSALLAPPRQAIAAPALHLHFHGVNTEDAAAIMRQQAIPARPAIQEKP